jgi:hypothetical protein
MVAWHSGHRVHLQNIRSRVRIPPGCKVLSRLSMYIAVLLSKLNTHCHCVNLRKINTSKIFLYSSALSFRTFCLIVLCLESKKKHQMVSAFGVGEWLYQYDKFNLVDHRVARLFFQTNNPNLGKFYRCFRLVNVYMFYGHSEYFIEIWDILWPFGIFCIHLLHFSGFGIMYQEKSGNPGWSWKKIVSPENQNLQGVIFHGSMLWSQFSAIFANFWQENWRFSCKPIEVLQSTSIILTRERQFFVEIVFFKS